MWVTVPDLEQTTQFLVEGLDAVSMYDIIDAPMGGEWIEQSLGVPEGTVIRAIRLSQGHGRPAGPEVVSTQCRDH
ncbi:hypothetical protein ACR9E3_09660 [Actinomycetospora sp. C-140]